MPIQKVTVSRDDRIYELVRLPVLTDISTVGG